MAPPSDWGQLFDGNADAGAAAVLPDPDEHPDFGGHRARHLGYASLRCHNPSRTQMRPATVSSYTRGEGSRLGRWPTTVSRSSCGWASPLPPANDTDSCDSDASECSEGEQGQRAMDGSRQIARLVTAKTTLTHLSLSTNQMGDEALAVVASDALN